MRLRGERAPTLVLLFVLLTACADPMPPMPEDGFSFAVFGDAPYGGDDTLRVERLIKVFNEQNLRWVMHIGDILWYPCSDEMLNERHALFQRIDHPFIYTPGDNEWADCHEALPGGYAPLERLDKLREVFFANPLGSAGGSIMLLSSQSEAREYAEYVENVRWEYGEVVFSTHHLVGSFNARIPFEQRTEADDRAATRREQAATAWMRETFATARQHNARGVFLALHANPNFEAPIGHRTRAPYEAFLTALEEEVAAFDGPVVLVHGDTHEMRIDQPLRDRHTLRHLGNFTRVEVYGSPDVGWVRVDVDPSQPELFTVHGRKVRRGLWLLGRLFGLGS